MNMITEPERIDIKPVREMTGFCKWFYLSGTGAGYTIRDRLFGKDFTYHKVVAVPLEEVHII